MLEYATVLEDQVTALKAAANNKSLAAGKNVVSKFAASATTVHSKNSALIEELQSERKEQAAQMKRLTALVNSIASKSDAPSRSRQRLALQRQPQ